MDIGKLLVSDKISSGEENYKYFIGYLRNDHEFKALHLMPRKRSPYIKSYHGKSKRMYFLIEDDDLLEKCNTMWNKVSADIKK